MLSLRSVAALEPHFRLGSGEPQHQYVPRWKKGVNEGSISGNNNNYSISVSLTVENCKISTSHFPSGMEEVMYSSKAAFLAYPQALALGMSSQLIMVTLEPVHQSPANEYWEMFACVRMGFLG